MLFDDTLARCRCIQLTKEISGSVLAILPGLGRAALRYARLSFRKRLLDTFKDRNVFVELLNYKFLFLNKKTFAWRFMLSALKLVTPGSLYSRVFNWFFHRGL